MQIESKLSRRSALVGAASAAAGAFLAGNRALAQVPLGGPIYQGRELAGPRSLVCVYLNGGNDLFNVLVPTSSPAYANYASLRQELALPLGDLLPLGSGGYGMHPSCAGLRDLFAEGRLGIVANAGILHEPLTLAEYQAALAGASGGPQVPKNLFSHSDQTHAFWTSYAAQAGQTYTGWGGRLAERLLPFNPGSALPPSFTLAGTSAWAATDNPAAAQVALSPQTGAQSFESFDGDTWPPHEPARGTAWDAIRSLPSGHPLEQQLRIGLANAVERNSLIESALDASSDPSGGDVFQTPYDELNPIAAQLRSVARLIFAREQLGQRAQVFYVSAGSWDTHGTQLSDQAGLLAMLDDGLTSFYRLTQELGLADTVTTFVASEFGRTLATNGDGTDHGWGTHYLALGDAVAGGQIHGDMPSFELGGPDDAGNAILPQRSTEQFGSTLAKWMGVSAAQRQQIFPNLVNFPSDDLGFML